MTPDALRAVIASARLRPRMYGTDAHDLSGYLHGLTAGAYDGPLNVAAQWQSAWTTSGWHVGDPLADTRVCDVADRVVAALWPQGDAPAGDECAAYSAAPLDTPMPPAFVAALASLSPAEAGALDLDALHARLWSPTCSQCGAVDPPTEDAERWDGQRFRRHVDCPMPDDIYASEVGDHGLTRAEQRALVARVRELEAQLAAAQPAVARDALRNGRFAAHCCACSAEWPLGVRDCPGCGHPDRAAGAVPDAAQPTPLDFAASLAAVRNGRFVPAPRCPQCDGLRRIDDARGDTVPCPLCVPRSCGGCSATWPLDRRDCPGCGYPDRDAGAVPDTDLCPKCGALDLDHACPKSAATVAGEAFAAEHPYAAGAIMGGVAKREDGNCG